MARLAVLAIFFLNGVGIATWVVRIPAVKEKLSLSAGLLGIALLGVAVGALASMTVAGWLIARFGSRPVVGTVALLFALALVPPSLAPNLPLLVLSLVLLGAANGALDVSMNAQAVAIEKEYGKPIMASFHASFSLGGLAGAGAGGLIASLGVGVGPHFFGIAALLALTVVVSRQAMLPAEVDAGGSGGGPSFARPTWALLGLGVISFCVLLGEGAIGDWSAVYLRNTLLTGPGFAAAGYAAFSLMMVAGRITGDRLTGYLGPARLVRLGGAVATVGLGLSLASGHPLVALAGFASAGAGFSIVFPLALSAAGRTKETAPGPALAAVSTLGYTGFLAGPPIIGFLAQLFGLGAALYVVVLLSAAIMPLAGAAGRGVKG
ncbi:MAG: MFS transporter [Rubrobacteraceae bacterium]